MNVAQRSFAAGELAPAVRARTDIARYEIGLAIARNGTILKTGGFRSRAGTEYLGSTKDNGATRLKDIDFALAGTFVLEFGEGFLRFRENGALVTVGTLGAWLTATAYTIGTQRTNGGTNYICTVAHTSGASTEPGVGASWASVWYALTGNILELPTPYTGNEIFELQVGYQLNLVWMTHRAHAPRTMRRVTDSQWILESFDPSDLVAWPTNAAVTPSGSDGVGYAVTAVYADGTESILSDPAYTGEDTYFFIQLFTPATYATVTWDAVAGAVSYNIYRVGSFGIAATKQGTSTTTTFVDTSPFNTTFDGPPESQGLFASAGNYPAVVGAHQQRQLFAGSDNEPDVVNASQVGDPLNFDISSPIEDDDAMKWRQVGKHLHRILHLIENGGQLFQFTNRGEVLIRGDTDSVLRPGEVNPQQISSNGAAVYPQPLSINTSILYPQARGSVVRDLFPIEAQGFSGTDTTLMSAHLLRGRRIVDWCYQQNPDSIAWIVLDNGDLLSLTYVRELGMLAWCRHDTDGGFFESIACVPEDDQDAVYAVVRRNVLAYLAGTVGGSSVNYGDADYSPALEMILAIGSGAARTADDGDTWAFSSIPDTSPTHNTWNFVRWCEALARWVTVSGNANLPTPNAVSVATSPTGAAWDGALLTSGDREWFGIADLGVDAGTVVVFGTGNKAAATGDGEAWTEYDTTGITNSLYGKPVYFPDSGRLIGMDVNRGVVYSDDLIAFTGVVGLQDVGIRGTWRSAAGRVFAPASTVLHYSDDEGDTWDSVGTGGVGFDWMVFLPSGRIYAGNASTNPPSVSYSDDHGLTWIAAPAPQWPATNGTAVAVRRSDGEQILLFANGDADYTLSFPVPGRYIERFTNREAATPVLMDCAVEYTGGGTTVTGLGHLEGKAVSVVVDGVVVASPNNPAYPVLTVLDGEITIPNAGASVWVGLPITTDLKTLDIDTASGPSMRPGNFSLTGLGLYVEETGGVYAGQKAIENSNGLSDGSYDLQPLEILDEEGNVVTGVITGYREVNIEGAYSNSGAIFLRNVDPVPLTVLALVPQGHFPEVP